MGKKTLLTLIVFFLGCENGIFNPDDDSELNPIYFELDVRLPMDGMIIGDTKQDTQVKFFYP